MTISRAERSQEKPDHSATDLSQTMGASQLTKQHRHKLRPAIEALGSTLGPMLSNQSLEIRPKKNSQQLAENTGKVTHGGKPPRVEVKFSSPPSSPGRGFPFNPSKFPCFGQEWGELY